jgi:hypothetical protein
VSTLGLFRSYVHSLVLQITLEGSTHFRCRLLLMSQWGFFAVCAFSVLLRFE